MRKLVSIMATCRILDVGKSHVHGLVNKGILDSVKVGGRRLIVVESIDNVTGGNA